MRLGILLFVQKSKHERLPLAAHPVQTKTTISRDIL
jgi:hypothetical protein